MKYKYLTIFFCTLFCLFVCLVVQHNLLLDFLNFYQLKFYNFFKCGLLRLKSTPKKLVFAENEKKK